MARIRMIATGSNVPSLWGKQARLAPRPRARTVARWLLAGPAAIVVALVALLGMPLYIPPGPGNVDNLMVPLVLLPLVWGLLFFHAVLDRSLARIAAVAGGVAVLNLAIIALHFLG